jgi:(p)ppGpp synthase/HD superfamily hydrolase
MKHTLIEAARFLAIDAHDHWGKPRVLKNEYGQHIRKSTKEPYWKHPEAVAQIVETAGGSPEMIAAAWLHDTIQDTLFGPRTMRELMGDRVTELVLQLTDISKPEDGNRAVRKEIDRQHTAKAEPDAKTIKLADIIHNTADIVANDPNFAVRYMREIREVMKVLQEGHAGLYYRAMNQVEEYFHNA